MKKARVVVLATAITAVLGAAWLASAIVFRDPEAQQVEKTVGATDVLEANKGIGLGNSVRADDFKWQQWPIEGLTPGLITKESQPNAPSDLSGAVARPSSWAWSRPIRLFYLKLVAKRPDCPDWPENVARDSQNLPWPNMGCGTQKNLAAMVADPEDFLSPHLEMPRPSERRDWSGAST